MEERKSFVPAKPGSRKWPDIVGVSLCIVTVLAIALALCSCAHTPENVSREYQLYLATSNTVASAHQVVPYLPAPVNSVAEGVFAVVGAGLAFWASHLHRSVAELKKNGNGNGHLGAGPAAPPAGPPAAPPAPAQG
jgi:hypothetical protein